MVEGLFAQLFAAICSPPFNGHISAADGVPNGNLRFLVGLALAAISHPSFINDISQNETRTYPRLSPQFTAVTLRSEIFTL